MHEWTGVTLCVLFLLHHALNPGWHRGLFKGRYSASRVWLTVVDLLLTLAMVAVIVSAILVSRHVFDFLACACGQSAGALICRPPCGRLC